jgi:hypothetical protein
LPSSKQQVERWKPQKSRFNKWSDEGGKRIENLFPNYWKNAAKSTDYIPYRFTDWIVNTIYAQAVGSIGVRIMNMHSGNSIRTTFFCETLPPNTFPHACEESRQQDRQETMDGVIRIANPSQSNAYDQLVMEADAAGLIPNTSENGKRRPRRRAVVLAAQTFHETILNKTVRDFPVVCPNQSELKALLKKSIDLERQILPEFHGTDLGERQHRIDFWRDVDKNLYCDIDTIKILADPQWINFFVQLR